MNGMRRAIGSITVGVTLSLLTGGEALAATFNFTRIADTSDRFSSFGYLGPSINNAGTVAFDADLDAGNTGIFIGNGMTTTTIADTSDSFSGFDYRPSINDVGTVAFAARLDDRSSGIFKSNGNAITPITTNPSPEVGFSSISLNNGGDIAYLESNPLASSIQALNATTGERSFIGGPATRITSVSPPVINDAGTVVFSTNNPADSFLITNNLTGNSINTRLTGTSFSGIRYSSFRDPTINNAGTLAFVGTESTVGLGVFALSGTTINTIADANGLFGNFRSPSINNNGAVAFLAGLDTGESGIFTGSNPLTDKVIATGDLLFGSRVTSLGFYQEGLNDLGQVAFLATFEDGSSGIFRAERQNMPAPVPEPVSILSILAFGALGAGAVSKRKLTGQSK